MCKEIGKAGDRQGEGRNEGRGQSKRESERQWEKKRRRKSQGRNREVRRRSDVLNKAGNKQVARCESVLIFSSWQPPVDS